MSRSGSGVRAAAVVMLAALFMLSGISSAFGEKTIALSTGTIELSLAAGSSASNTIAVANNGDEPFKAMVYASDVIYDEAGVPTYVKPTGASGELLKSPASWLTLRMPAETQVIANTPYVELDPGEEMLVDFDMVVPAGVAPGDYSAIVFFEMFDTDATTGTTSRISGRIGARIVVRIAGDVVDRLDLAPFWVRGLVIGDTVPYSFTLTNEGNIDKRYVPSLVVLDSSEAEVQRLQLEENSVVYADNLREYSGSLALDKPLFGKYTLRAEIGYDRETGSAAGATVAEVLEKDRTFWVFPLWFVILVIVVISIPILWLSWRSSVKAAARKAAARQRQARRHAMTDELASGSEWTERPPTEDE